MLSLGIFSMVPLTEPCALRLIHPLKVSTRDFSWGKGGHCVWLMTYHPCSAEMSRKSRTLTHPEPLGPPRPVAGDFTLLYYHIIILWDHRRLCDPSLTKTSLCGAYLYFVNSIGCLEKKAVHFPHSVYKCFV